MNALLEHANRVSDDMFGELSEADAGRGLVPMAPVLATPAVAFGVAVGIAAFHAGYMYGIARSMAEGTRPPIQPN